MKFEIKCRWTAKVLFETEAVSMGAAVEKAVEARVSLAGADLAGADLAGADLARANLARANLADADLAPLKEDFFKRLGLASSEVPGLYKAVVDGRIDGSCYEGECACFVGTVANVRGVKYDKLKDLIGLEAQSSSPTERFFLAIRKGDTPESNPAARIVCDWIKEFAAEKSIALPTHTVSWSA